MQIVELGMEPESPTPLKPENPRILKPSTLNRGLGIPFCWLKSLKPLLRMQEIPQFLQFLIPVIAGDLGYIPSAAQKFQNKLTRDSRMEMCLLGGPGD